MTIPNPMRSMKTIKNTKRRGLPLKPVPFEIWEQDLASSSPLRLRLLAENYCFFPENAWG